MPSFASRTLTPAFALLLLAGVALGQNQPETSTPQVDAAIESFETEWQEVMDGGSPTYDLWIAVQEAAVEDVDFSELSVEDLVKLRAANLLNSESVRDRAKERVAALMSETDGDSVDAVALATMDLMLRGMPTRTSRPDPALQKELTGKVLNHPKLHEAIKEGKAQGIGVPAAVLGPDGGGFTDQLVALGVMLADAPATLANDVATFWQTFGEMPTGEEGIDADTKESIRKGLVKNLRDALEATDEAGEPVLAENVKGWIENFVGRMDGAAARGMLIGHSMPDMTIAWSSDSSITSFADLKGKVVVVDFWATWCGPCISSFPKVRELQEHYAGKPVTIVGVTSLQGAVYGVPEHEGPVDCEGDPQKEYDLMPAVMGTHNVTWPVVFTEQEVFNPDFGVNGIPHVAIIDAEGKVRFNGMHPAAPMGEKTSKIDALLVEMGVEPPANEEAGEEEKPQG